MLRAVNNTYFQSSLLYSLPHVTHGYSMRSLGDMRRQNNRNKLFERLGVADLTLIMAEQVHGTFVAEVTQKSHSPIFHADGLLANAETFNNAIPSIGVIVADCVPLLFANIKRKAIAVAHAGWKGTAGNIAALTVQKMIDSGSDPKDIYVSIGPHIGMCCYDVSEERIREFNEVFYKDPRAMSKIDGTWHLDIGYINFIQLLNAGILREHIDAGPTCTSCQIDRFYSFRKDSKETFGEILGVISLKA